MPSNAPRRAILIVAAAAVAVTLALGYLGARYLSPPSREPVEKLSIALPVLPQSGLLHIAAAKGYFAEERLDVTLVPISHGKVGIDLVLQGKADLTVAAEVPFVIAVMQGDALSIAVNMLDMPNGHAVIARRDRGIAVASDLVGKKVGVTFGTSGEYNLWAFLIRHRLAPDSATLVDVLPGEIAREIARGTVDAAVTWKPLVFDVQAALAENGLVLTGDNGYSQMNIVLGRTAFLKAQPEAIERLVRALLKAEAFTRTDPRGAQALLAAWTGSEVTAMQQDWKDYDFRLNLLQSHLITLEDEARWAMARGYVAAGPVPNFLPNLHVDALLAVRPERVTVVR